MNPTPLSAHYPPFRASALATNDAREEAPMRLALKHHLNPFHVYCRLRDLGLGKRLASFLCRIYERAIFKRYFTARV
jgi:hypothetical protein